MMINDMKKNELNEQDMNGTIGGFGGSDYLRWEQQKKLYGEETVPFDMSGGEVGTAWEAVGTAWAVVKHAFEICG